jgi:cardiolipin synthase
VYDRAFAERMSAVFEEDLKATQRYTLEMWRGRPLKERFVEKVILPLRSQL